jgi:hypothetical protein
MLAFTVDNQLAKQTIVLDCSCGRRIEISVKKKPKKGIKWSLGIEAPMEVRVHRILKDN